MIIVQHEKGCEGEGGAICRCVLKEVETIGSENVKIKELLKRVIGLCNKNPGPVSNKIIVEILGSMKGEGNGN